MGVKPKNGGGKNGIATRFKPGSSPNPGGRPRGISEFRARCREKIAEIVEVMEHVFFKGTWPKQGKQKPHQVTDAVRMTAGLTLVSHGWGTAPSSTEIKITLPSTDQIKQITPEMTHQQAADAYARTLAAERQLLGSPDERPIIDVTPEDGES
jgi:hypothetical protein